MSLIKFSSNLDYDFGVESVHIIKNTRDLVKRGSVENSLKYEKTPNQTDVHLIALGAYEGTGDNRNGDRFLEDDCIKYHHTFVEADRALHKQHKNKPEDTKYGNIKASAYNKDMRRIELIVGHDNDKAADILDEIEKKGQADYSMACKVAYDVCSRCKHKAKNEAERCEHIPDHLGELDKYGEMTAMINPKPKWFEISWVKRGADRIGKSLRVLMGGKTKQASYPQNEFLEGLYIPDEPTYKIKPILLSKKASTKRSLVKKLAEMEKRVMGVAKGVIKDTTDKVIQSNLQDKPETLSPDTLDELRKIEPSKLFKVLADNGIVLDPENFMKYVFDKDHTKKETDDMKSVLPSIFSQMKADNDEDELVNDEKFEPSNSEVIPSFIRKLISGLTDSHSIFGEPTRHRVIRIMIIGKGPKKIVQKEMTKDSSAHILAKAYASYKLAALNYLDENHKLNDEVILNAVIQNQI